MASTEYDVAGLIRDPEFQSKPWAERHQIMLQVEPDYKAMKPAEQAQYLNALKKEDFWKPSAPQKPKEKNLWEKTKEGVGHYLHDAKEIALEPVRMASEAVAGTANAVAKAGKGLYGGAMAIDKGLSGGSLDDALLAGRQAIGDRNTISSPLEPSHTSQFVGQNIVKPAIEKASEYAPKELVEGIVEAGGDIASLFGIKPGIKTIKGGVTNALKAGAESGMPFLNPERIYGSAARMPLSKKWLKEIGAEDISKRKAAVGVALEDEVPVSNLGIQQAKNQEKVLRGKVDAIIKELDTTGALMPKEKLKAGLTKTEGELSAQSVADVEGTDFAQNLVNRLYDKRFNKMGHEVQVGTETIPARVEKDPFGQSYVVEPEKKGPIMERRYKPSEVQAIKRHLYKMEEYGKAQLAKGLGTMIKELGNKGMAKEAKEWLEQLKPGLKTLNAKDGAYINLLDALETAVPRINNKNVVDLGTKVLATAHPILATIDFALGLPTVRSKLAFALNRARKGSSVNVGKPMAKTLGAGIASTATKPQNPYNDAILGVLGQNNESP